MRNSAATPSRSATLESRLGIAVSGWVNKTSIATSSCSIMTGLDIIAPHLSTQSFERAQLQLFHCAFAAADLQCYFTDASLIDEATSDYLLLVNRQRVDQLKQDSALLDRGVGSCKLDFLY